jgi:septum site-determining protein MinC
MSADASAKTAPPAPGFELKLGSIKLPLLRLLGTDIDAVTHELAGRVKQAPQFFRNLPIVIDLTRLEDGDATMELPLLIGLLRGYGMIPVGMRGGTKAQHEVALAMDLAILSGEFTKKRTSRPSARIKKPKTRTASTKVITRPVRSGQRVYAAGGDLVILSQVGSGAEVMADGHIHIYGPLKGRALAGVKGDQLAQVFCRDFQPELVAVAGRYHVSDELDPEVLGRSVQVLLKKGKLQVKAR